MEGGPDSTVEVRPELADTWLRPAVRPPPDDFPLVEPDRYARGFEVARGGLGRVVQAFDRRLGRRVALKELLARDPKAEERFVREARITARLEHPNIVPVHEAGRWPNGERFYAMKLVEGRTLSEALGSAESREERLELLAHLIDVADAVAYAHSQGILHRDLKPANVMVGSFGETVLLDWGLAKDLLDEAADPPSPHPETQTERPSIETSDGIVVGTPPYMAPEQARGDRLDERADVYALGAMLYQVLCGKRPYEDVAPKEVLLAVVSGPPAPIARLASDMPRDLVAVVEKAMARDPGHRYPSAKEMAEELRRFTTGQLVAAHRYSPAERVRRFVGRHWAALAVAGLLLGVLAVFAGWSFRGLRVRSEAARVARSEADQRVLELTLEKARSMLARDPTEAVAWLKRVVPPLPGVASVAAAADERGVAWAVLGGHTQEVDRVKTNPSGAGFASASRDGTVRLWDWDGTYRVVAHGSRVTALAYADDGNHLLTGAYDGSVRVIELRSGAVRVFERHMGPVVALGFAPTGDRFVSLGRDGRLLLWSLDGEVAESFTTPAVGDWAEVRFRGEGRVLSAGHGARVMEWDLEQGRGRTAAEASADVTAFAIEGDLLVLGGADGSVALGDLGRRALRTVGGHDGEVRRVVLSPSGDEIASAGLDGRVIVWSIRASKPQQVFEDHEERVTALGFSPNGRFLASASWDGTVRLRDLETLEGKTFRGHSQVVTDLGFEPNGRALVSASWDTTLRVWPLRSSPDRTLEGHRVGVHALAFSPDGRSFASGGHDHEVRRWDARTRTAEVLAGHEDTVYRVLYSPDGRFIASSSDDRTVRLWPTGGGRPRVLEGHEGDVEELAFSPDGRSIASAGRAGDVFRFSVQDGTATRLSGHRAPVTGVAFVAPDQVVSASLDGQLILHGQGPILSGAGPLRGLDATDDGRRLVVAGGRGELWVFSFPDGQQVAHIQGLHEPDRVKLSRDGTLVAVASGQRGLWLCNLAYALCDRLEGHEARVFALDFSPTGRVLATGSGDHGVRLWDVETLESRPLAGHRAPVFDVSFSPDGSWVLSGSGDAAVRLWATRLPPRPQDLPDALERLTRHVAAD